MKNGPRWRGIAIRRRDSRPGRGLCRGMRRHGVAGGGVGRVGKEQGGVGRSGEEWEVVGKNGEE